uniref:t-SNARE coiled-coil homology domain-containing protein n=1 Tax=Chlamydomonas leiostraca TaxID=1034604 RepID=A0A7S0WX34_9CHLO|mmetsp:Transcript_3274/g.8139  ORF Transcript_3274/g.8139 Transcript_3274/m.8139 type:complete len:274 (+) Transcript_3274:225-1046(+)
MSLFDLTERANAVLRKYEKYDAPAQTNKGKSDDPFMEVYEEVDEEVAKLVEAANDLQLETNRSVVAQKNAEIRRAKQVLLTDAVEELQKKVKKGKGVSKQLIKERQAKIQEIIDRIYAVPDGMSSGVRRPHKYGTGKGDKGSKSNPVVLDVEGKGGKMTSNPLYYQHTDQTQTFEKAWESSKVRQDQVLERIDRGVSRLGEIARNVQEEVDRQNPIIDDIEAQMDKVTGQLKTNNAKLKGLVTKMRSSRNFCVDVILICILLAIGAYIYSMFK